MRHGVLDDLTGRRFGRLFVLGRGPNSECKAQHPRWNCVCDCGNERLVRSYNLREELTKSCGCMKREKLMDYNLGR